MAFSKTHDETAPADHTTFTSQPGSVRDTKIAFRERLQFGGVYFPSTHDELAGEYSYVRMANQSSAPTAVTGKWMLYVTSSGLFVRGPDGTSIQITTTAALNTSDVFVTGDWIISTVTTPHSGWTNVSVTYTGKFMRINATPLTTGGTDSHTHTGPSHTHTVPRDGWTTGGANNASGRLFVGDGGTALGQPAADNTSGASGTGATASADNVPAYVQVVTFQKN